MFCPECQGEYRLGTYRCPDCDVELLYELLEEVEAEPVLRPRIPDDEEMVEVFRTTDCSVEGIIKSLLIPSGIPYTVSGEHSSGMVLHAAVDLIFLVPASCAEEARELLKELH